MKKFFLGVALLTAFAFAKAQTAEEIVNKHIEAIGGKANYDKLQNVVMEGSMSAQGATINLTITKVLGKLSRQDISVMGMTGYDLTTDKDGWTFMPFMGQSSPVEKTGDMLKASQQELDFSDALYNYQAKGTTIELQGKEDVSGTDSYKLRLTSKAGDVETVYVDPATFFINRVSSIKKLNGQEFPVTIDFSDYKDVEGVKFPFNMGTPQGSIVFSSIKANQTIDDKLYKHE